MPARYFLNFYRKKGSYVKCAGYGKNNGFQRLKTRKILDKDTGNIYKCKSAFVTEKVNANE